MPGTTTSQIENAKSLNDEIIQSIDLLRVEKASSARSHRSSHSKGSSKSMDRRKEELAKAKELQVMLDYLEKEERLKDEIEKLSRQSARLEVSRQIDVAMARAQAFNESDEDDLESVASEIKSGRVQEYIRQQDPENHVDNDTLVAPVPNHTPANEASTHQSHPLNHFAQPSVLDTVIRRPLSHTVPPGFPDEVRHLNQTIRYELPNTIGSLPHLQSLYQSTPEDLFSQRYSEESRRLTPMVRTSPRPNFSIDKITAHFGDLSVVIMVICISII
jgi:hypothetical protein